MNLAPAVSVKLSMVCSININTQANANSAEFNKANQYFDTSSTYSTASAIPNAF